MIGIASPAESGLPGVRSAVAISRTTLIPMTGIPVLVLHGPIPMRAALGIASDQLLVRPLAPLVPSSRLRREEVTSIDLEEGHWYALGRAVVCIHRAKGPTVRLMSPIVPGVPDSTESLGRLLRAWWRSSPR